MAATEYEYPDQIHIPQGQGEQLSGNLNSFRNIDGDVVHWRGTNSITVYNFFPQPSLSTISGQLKVVYDYTGSSYLFMVITYYGSSATDPYTLASYPVGYKTATFTTRPNLEVLFVQFVVFGSIEKAHLWIDYLGVKYTSGGGSGGGCPILSVFDGVQYQEEGLLDIHDPEGNDIINQHVLINSPAAINNRFQLRLTEHPKTISHIDRVELWGKLSNNRMIKLPLKSAIHSEEGHVKSLLKSSDDKKVEALGADHNNGISQFIDLEFYAPRHIEFVEFVFVIEGNNRFEK